MSLYDDLGVRPDATEAEIASAYRKAARRHHPDAGGNAADFDKIQRAATILRDPARRAEYDRTGTVEDSGPSLQAQANELLCSVFAQVIAQVDDLGLIDVVKSVRKSLEHQRDQVASQRSQTVTHRSRLQGTAKRLSYSGGETDVIHRMIDAQILALDAKLIEIDRTTAMIERAAELAQDYSWRSEPDADATMLGLQRDSIAWEEIAR